MMADSVRNETIEKYSIKISLHLRFTPLSKIMYLKAWRVQYQSL